MSPYATFGAVLVSAAGSLVFSTLTYSLRELSRVKLSDYLTRRGREDWLEPTVRHSSDLILVTAVGRMLAARPRADQILDAARLGQQSLSGREQRGRPSAA